LGGDNQIKTGGHESSLSLKKGSALRRARALPIKGGRMKEKAFREHGKDRRGNNGPQNMRNCKETPKKRGEAWQTVKDKRIYEKNKHRE